MSITCTSARTSVDNYDSTMNQSLASRLGEKVSIRIAQNLFGDHYEFSISVNCRLVWGEVNPLPHVVPNIVLYTGNKDHKVQEGVMSNLEVMSN